MATFTSSRNINHNLIFLLKYPGIPDETASASETDSRMLCLSTAVATKLLNTLKITSKTLPYIIQLLYEKLTE